MRVTKFHISTEVAKALKGQKTKVPIETLFHTTAPVYLEAVSGKREEGAEREK
jgi:hypothetical protein